ncbi:hypothetical protein LM602_00830 [Candidatus Acetothermia bacterium]|jgi:hypothetical protein|nr:hypothetical protein [Candidatus Acetothermia bacterium]MCI2431089.1 hypothetical protein [Candidatus Acetothermia bacterium]MCI2435713.1 hypothetical protein [Candidatus Acetothermia bacterium]
MTRYTVEMHGNWTRAWPSEPITFLDCVFQGEESISKGFFQVFAEVQARDHAEASNRGRERIEEACYLFEFCLGGTMQLIPNQVTITERGSVVNEIEISVGLQATLYSPTPPTPDQLKRLNDVQKKINQNDCLRRVIRWWGEARRETEPIDRFIKLWVAFEVLTRNQYGSKQFLDGAKECLEKLYPNHHGEKIRQLVNDLQTTRSDVFLHQGVWDSGKARNKGLILETVLEDLLIDYFGLPAKLKVGQYLS